MSAAASMFAPPPAPLVGGAPPGGGALPGPGDPAAATAPYTDDSPDLSASERNIVTAIAALALPDTLGHHHTLDPGQPVAGQLDDLPLVSRLVTLANAVRGLCRDAPVLVAQAGCGEEELEVLHNRASTLLEVLRELVNDVRRFFGSTSPEAATVNDFIALRQCVLERLKKLALGAKRMIVLADDLIDGGSHAHALGDGHGPGSPAHGGYYSDSEEELDEDDEICHLCSLPIRPQEPRVLVDEPATGPATGASTDSIDDDPLASPPLAPPHQQPSHSSMSLAAGGVYIHIHCMRCNVCAASLLEAPFSLDQNERVLCVGCSPKCHQCHQTILRDLVQAFGRTYHGDCFQCYQCHQPMKSSPQCSSSGLGGSNGTPGSSQHFYQQSGQPICSRCMSNRSVFIKRAFPEADELLHTTPPTPTDADPSMDEAPLTPTTAESDHFISLSDFQHGSVSKLPRSDSTLSVMTPRPSSTMVFNLANSRTLEGVLNSEQGTDYFVRFCIEDYSVEKIFFVLDLRQFETVQIASASDLHLYATTIFHKYLRPDAELAVDVPLDLRMDLFKVIESNRVSRSMFQRARALVYQQLEDEVFPKFFYSILGRRYLESIEFDDNGEVSLLSLAQRRKPAFSDIEAAVSMANLSASNQASGIPNTVVIVGASVRTFERRRDPDKYYAYEVVVHRAVCRQRPAPVDANSSQDQAIAITTIGVYRRFSQFFQLHQALTKQFPRLVFPPFPPRMKFGRSQVQRVTVQRLAHLDVYMKGLMQLAEVKTSARLLEFLHPSDDDIQNYRFNKRLSAISVDFTLKYH